METVILADGVYPYLSSYSPCSSKRIRSPFGWIRINVAGLFWVSQPICSELPYRSMHPGIASRFPKFSHLLRHCVAIILFSRPCCFYQRTFWTAHCSKSSYQIPSIGGVSQHQRTCTLENFPHTFLYIYPKKQDILLLSLNHRKTNRKPTPWRMGAISIKQNPQTISKLNKKRALIPVLSRAGTTGNKKTPTRAPTTTTPHKKIWPPPKTKSKYKK